MLYSERNERVEKVLITGLRQELIGSIINVIMLSNLADMLESKSNNIDTVIIVVQTERFVISTVERRITISFDLSFFFINFFADIETFLISSIVTNSIHTNNTRFRQT